MPYCSYSHRVGRDFPKVVMCNGSIGTTHGSDHIVENFETALI